RCGTSSSRSTTRTTSCTPDRRWSSDPGAVVRWRSLAGTAGRTGGRVTSNQHGPRPAEPLPALPTLAEQVSSQLGGWRGMVEAAVPVSVFIVVNLITSLNPALIASVAVAVAIALARLAQRRSIRYAVNGLLGIGLGALIAWRSGEARDFYLPGIVISYGYAAGMLLSVAIRHPVVGWLWSVLFAKGSGEWRREPRLLGTFTWLTLLWAVVWIAKVSVQAWLWGADQEHLLGVARLALGTPPYLLLLVITVWVVRRVQRSAVVEPA